MALVPNGRMRVQEKQSLLRNGLFAFAQAQQQSAQQKPTPDPRVQVEQQDIGNNGQQPAAGQNPQQAAPAAPVADGGEGAETPKTPAANMDVMQDQVDNASEEAIAQDASPQPGKQIDTATKASIVNFAKELATKIMGVPFRLLKEMGGFTQWSSDAQHNDTVTLKFPNFYYGRPELGEISKEHRQKIEQLVQHKFGMFYVATKGDDDNLFMEFSAVDKTPGVINEHDARLQRVYKIHKQPGGGAPGQSKAASTLGEMIKDRRLELFNTMRKIAHGSN